MASGRDRLRAVLNRGRGSASRTATTRQDGRPTATAGSPSGEPRLAEPWERQEWELPDEDPPAAPPPGEGLLLPDDDLFPGLADVIPLPEPPVPDGGESGTDGPDLMSSAGTEALGAGAGPHALDAAAAGASTRIRLAGEALAARERTDPDAAPADRDDGALADPGPRSPSAGANAVGAHGAAASPRSAAAAPASTAAATRQASGARGAPAASSASSAFDADGKTEPGDGDGSLADDPGADRRGRAPPEPPSAVPVGPEAEGSPDAGERTGKRSDGGLFGQAAASMRRRPVRPKLSAVGAAEAEARVAGDDDATSRPEAAGSPATGARGGVPLATTTSADEREPTAVAVATSPTEAGRSAGPATAVPEARGDQRERPAAEAGDIGGTSDTMGSSRPEDSGARAEAARRRVRTFGATAGTASEAVDVMGEARAGNDGARASPRPGTGVTGKGARSRAAAARGGPEEPAAAAPTARAGLAAFPQRARPHPSAGADDGASTVETAAASTVEAVSARAGRPDGPQQASPLRPDEKPPGDRGDAASLAPGEAMTADASPARSRDPAHRHSRDDPPTADAPGPSPAAAVVAFPDEAGDADDPNGVADRFAGRAVAHPRDGRRRRPDDETAPVAPGAGEGPTDGADPPADPRPRSQVDPDGWVARAGDDRARPVRNGEEGASRADAASAPSVPEDPWLPSVGAPASAETGQECVRDTEAGVGDPVPTRSGEAAGEGGQGRGYPVGAVPVEESDFAVAPAAADPDADRAGPRPVNSSGESQLRPDRSLASSGSGRDGPGEGDAETGDTLQAGAGAAGDERPPRPIGPAGPVRDEADGPGDTARAGGGRAPSNPGDGDAAGGLPQDEWGGTAEAAGAVPGASGHGAADAPAARADAAAGERAPLPAAPSSAPAQATAAEADRKKAATAGALGGSPERRVPADEAAGSGGTGGNGLPAACADGGGDDPEASDDVGRGAMEAPDAARETLLDDLSVIAAEIVSGFADAPAVAGATGGAGAHGEKAVAGAGDGLAGHATGRSPTGGAAPDAGDATSTSGMDRGDAPAARARGDRPPYGTGDPGASEPASAGGQAPDARSTSAPGMDRTGAPAAEAREARPPHATGGFIGAEPAPQRELAPDPRNSGFPGVGRTGAPTAEAREDRAPHATGGARGAGPAETGGAAPHAWSDARIGREVAPSTPAREDRPRHGTEGSCGVEPAPMVGVAPDGRDAASAPGIDGAGVSVGRARKERPAHGSGSAGTETAASGEGPGGEAAASLPGEAGAAPERVRTGDPPAVGDGGDAPRARDAGADAADRPRDRANCDGALEPAPAEGYVSASASAFEAGAAVRERATGGPQGAAGNADRRARADHPAPADPLEKGDGAVDEEARTAPPPDAWAADERDRRRTRRAARGGERPGRRGETSGPAEPREAGTGAAEDTDAVTADADTSPRGDDDPARDDGDGRRAGRSQRRAGTGKRREPAGSDDQAADAGSTPPEGRLRKGGEAHERDVDASTSSERGEAAPQRDEPPAAEGGAAGDDGSDGSGRGGGKAGKRDRLGKLLVERKRKRNRDTGRQGEASEAAPDPTAEGQREGAGKADVPATDDGAGAVPAVPAAARTDRRETGAEAAEAAEAGDVPWPRADRRRSPPSGAPPRWPAAHEDAADDAPVAEPVDESAEGGRRRRRVLRSSEDVAREAADGGGRSGGSRALARVSRREANRSLAPVPEETGTAVTTREGRQGGRNLKARQKQEPAPQTLTERQTRRLALPAQATERTRRPWFARLLVASLVLLVLLPTAAVAAFYMFKASPQYASVSQFAVRGAAIADDAEVPSILSGAGPPSMPEIADSLILVDYVHSREVVDSLIENVDFLRLYSRPEIDFHYRLDPDQPIEEIVDYWRMMSTIEFDETSMIMSLTVRAFTPEDAERVADHVIRLSENLVNELSSRARTDSVKLAREEVALAEARFRNARTALAEFRDQEFEIDPTATATQRQTIVGTLESELASQEALLSALRSTMSEESPRVVYVKNQIEALRRQIAQQREDVARPEEGVAAAEPVLTRRLSRFEELEAERQFAQEAYTSSLAALETARIEAAKQQRYLAVFVPPAMPQEALYPEGLRWTIIVAGGLFLGWGISALIGAAVRDHMA